MAKVLFKKSLCTFLSVVMLLAVFIVTPYTAGDVQAAVSAPTGLKVLEYGSFYAKIGWSKVSGASGYFLYRSTDGKTYSKLKTLSASTVKYSDKSLSAGKTYYYKIASYKKSNGTTTTGTKSSAVKLKTTTSSTVPTPKNLKVSVFTASSIKLTWSAVSGSVGYRIFRSTDNKNYAYIDSASASATSFTDTNLNMATTYYYKIAACKTISGTKAISPYSSALKARTSKNPVTITKTTTTPTAIRIYWKKMSGASGYQIYRYNSSTNSYTKVYGGSANTLSWADTGLDSNRAYTYRVRAYYKYSDGSAAYSPYNSITAKTTPASVTGVKAEGISTSSIKVSWNSMSGASGYQVYMLKPGAGSYTLAYTAGASQKSYTFTNLKASSSYSFKVRAFYTTDTSKNYSGYGTAKATTKATNDDNRIVEQIYNELNFVRSENSIRLLSRNDDLDAVAQIRADELTTYFSSMRPNGKSGLTALREKNLQYSFAGENIAFGYTSAESLINAWMNLGIEKENILDAHYTEVGIAVSYSNGIQYYCVMFYRPM